MELKLNLDKKTFDDFVLHHPNGHYGKTSMWGEVKQYQEKYTPILSGLFDQGKLIATALLLYNKKWGIRYLYIPWGICMDYRNLTVLQAFCHALRSYGEKQKIGFIKMDPNVRRFNEDGTDNERITQTLNEAGFIHKGYGYGYDGSWSNRYTLMIDIHDDYSIIQSHFTSARRSAIKKHNVFAITTEQKTADQLTILCQLEEELAQSKGFKPHTVDFFKNIMDSFPQNHVYAVSILNITESLIQLEQEINSKKYAKDPEAKAAKQKSYQELAALQEKYGSQVPIAAGLFLYAGTTSWDLYLYKRSDFNFVNGTDEIHQYMIQKMKEKGVTCYDMCGFSGSTDSQDPYYGLYLYKSSFGSNIVEHLGEFNMNIKPNAYQRFTKADRLYRKIRRKINFILHKK